MAAGRRVAPRSRHAAATPYQGNQASVFRRAREAKIQGVIGMEVVVETDGTVGEVRVTRSLDKMLGLDDEAVRTVKKWRFEPAKKDGVAVPVVVEIEMTFTLR